MINDIFNFCVYVLLVIGQVTVWGYELANIIIFVVVQPFLILLFFTLWIKSYNEKRYKDLINSESFVQDDHSFSKKNVLDISNFALEKLRNIKDENKEKYF